MNRPTLASLVRLYFKTGSTTFGGGDPTMAALERELVEEREWLSRDDFSLAYSLARITPGTNVLAFCVATAARMLGIRGAVAAVCAVTLPTAAVTVAITYAYEAARASALATAAVAGLIAAAVGMTLSAAWRLMKPQAELRSIAITGAAFLCAWKLGLSPILILAASALLGFFWPEGRPEPK